MGAYRCAFFCQAEDGIRCVYVTGVQTCALPISTDRAGSPRPERVLRLQGWWPTAKAPRAVPRQLVGTSAAQALACCSPVRSEERRGGKGGGCARLHTIKSA